MDDFKEAIKGKFSPLLDSYAAAQIKLYNSNGTTEIDPATLVTEFDKFGVGPWNPLVAKVELAEQVLTTSSNKLRTRV